jgi:hypothetical protein
MRSDSSVGKVTAYNLKDQASVPERLTNVFFLSIATAQTASTLACAGGRSVRLTH